MGRMTRKICKSRRPLNLRRLFRAGWTARCWIRRSMGECQATLAYPFSTYLNLFSRIELAPASLPSRPRTLTPCSMPGSGRHEQASLNHDNHFPKATNFVSWQSGVVITQIPVEMTHPCGEKCIRRNAPFLTASLA